ncbi:MAG: S-layer homology domain-containing protein [Thermoleophilia bacterium]|nr:S-layer homology domain-containing protein [Thermoleophilia bacterium]
MGRIILKFAVVLGFLAAVGGVVLLVQDSGVLSGGRARVVVVFTDIPENHRHRRQILAAVDAGLLEPATSTTFGPGDPVTRAQFAVALAKAMGWPVGPDEKEVFSDVEGGSGQVDPADYIAAVAQKNVMSGVAGDPPKFLPDQPVTLEQAFRVMLRAVGDRLAEPAQIDTVIVAMAGPDELKKAVQTAKNAKVLDDSGITPGATDFSQPLTKETAAVLLANLRRALGV